MCCFSRLCCCAVRYILNFAKSLEVGSFLFGLLELPETAPGLAQPCAEWSWQAPDFVPRARSILARSCDEVLFCPPPALSEGFPPLLLRMTGGPARPVCKRRCESDFMVCTGMIGGAGSSFRCTANGAHVASVLTHASRMTKSQ